MKVLAGDFQTRTGSGAQANFIYSHPIGQFTFPDPNKELWFWPRHVTYYMDSVEEIQEITDENKVKVLGVAGWGALGGLALGPLGLIAGMVLGGRGKVVVCAVKFKDGKQALLEVNQKEWTNIVAARFQLETMHRQGKNVYEKLSESGKSNSGIRELIIMLIVVVGALYVFYWIISL